MSFEQDVYLLSIPGNYYKVGRAANTESRVVMLQCGCPEKIKIEYIGDVASDGVSPSVFEHKLHRRLTAYKTSGEWFNVSAEIMARAWKETWCELRYPKIYARVERMRAHRRAKAMEARAKQ
jgi:hypothetical protein